MAPRETGGPSPEEAGEIRRPTKDEIIARAKTLISEIMDISEKSRERYYAVRLSALEKLIRDLKEYPPEVKEEEGKEAREILEQYYPGYAISDLEDLRRKLPDGIDKAHILSKIAEEYLDRVSKYYAAIYRDVDNFRKKYGRDPDPFWAQQLDEEERRLIDNCDVETLIDFVKEQDGEELDRGMPSAFLGLDSQLVDDDWKCLVEFIKNKYKMPLDEAFKVLKKELGEKKL